MQYKYCEADNFEDFASGRVIFNRPKLTNFPVRLAQEIYCRCLSYSKIKNDICIYDPCCGGGYLLTVLGILNSHSIKSIIASDIDRSVLEMAKQNLLLSTKEGLANRLQQLTLLYDKSKKISQLEAIESANSLLKTVGASNKKYDIDVFNSDILAENCMHDKNFKADIVLTDVPYGNLIEWDGSDNNAVNMLLHNIIPVLKPASIVAVCSDKKQKIKCEKYKRLEKQQIGKRKFEILKLLT